MYVLSIKVPIRKMSGNSFNDPRIKVDMGTRKPKHMHTNIEALLNTPTASL